jgi:hypothetical protein
MPTHRSKTWTPLTLHNKTATYFDQAIITAGGSKIWTGNGSYKANGSVFENNASTFLKLGDYINNLKGTADGKFILTATIGNVPANNWISVGFSSATTLGSAESGANFAASNGLKGVATAVNRGTDSLSSANYYAGVGTLGSHNPPDLLSGTITFRTTLDFTTAGGYNVNNNNFGTVIFDYATSTAPTSFIGSYKATYASDITFTGIGFSGFTQKFSSDATQLGTIKNLSLVQVTSASAVPEPSTYAALAGLVTLGFAVSGRRRAS